MRLNIAAWAVTVIAGLILAPPPARLAPLAVDPPSTAVPQYAVWQHSGLGLDAPNTAGNGGQYTQNGADAFRLVRTCASCRSFYMVNFNNRCMTVTGALKIDGALVNQYTCTAGAANQWLFLDARPLPGWTVYRIRFAHSGKCAGIGGGAVTPGVAVRQWPCNEQDWQRLTLITLNDG